MIDKWRNMFSNTLVVLTHLNVVMKLRRHATDCGIPWHVSCYVREAREQKSEIAFSCSYIYIYVHVDTHTYVYFNRMRRNHARVF